MTEAQWQVVLAIGRLVLEIERRTNDDTHEWFDIHVSNDRSIVEEAIRKDEGK